MNGQVMVLASGDLPFPPSVDDFFLPGLVDGSDPWLTKFTSLVWVSVAILIIFFLSTTPRTVRLVPTRGQWLAESLYGFVRNSIAHDVIGPEGLRFAPYLASLFSFVLINNMFAIVPVAQISPNSHIAFPAVLAILSYALFNYVGIRKHGLVGYVKVLLVPPAPAWLYPLLIPIEFLSNLILRPLTLALRLFANMFAGHVILLVFTLGGFAMLNANALLAPVSVASWLMTIVMTFFEVLVAAMQAYVFTLLTAVYVQGALADEH